MAIVIAGWALGVILLGVSVVSFVVDYRRTGILFRKKMPMMLVGALGGLLGVISVFSGIALQGM